MDTEGSHLSASEFKYCPVLFRMISEGVVELADGQLITVRAASTLNNLRAIREAIIRERPVSTLEIGLAFGASALAFLATLRETAKVHHQHTAIDPYQRSVWSSAAISSIASAGFSGNFEHIDEDSALALPRLCAEGARYDMIYVDGSHIYEDVFVDFYYCSRLLASRGLILFDDCTDRHVRKVIRFIDTNYSGILKRERVCLPVRRDLKRKIANALGVRQLVVYKKVAEPPRPWNVPYKHF